MENNFRDDLAKRAMAALIEGSTHPIYSIWGRIKIALGFKTHPWRSILNEENVAEEAYKYADAMIAQRNKQE